MSSSKTMSDDLHVLSKDSTYFEPVMLCHSILNTSNIKTPFIRQLHKFPMLFLLPTLLPS